MSCSFVDGGRIKVEEGKSRELMPKVGDKFGCRQFVDGGGFGGCRGNRFGWGQRMQSPITAVNETNKTHNKANHSTMGDELLILN